MVIDGKFYPGTCNGKGIPASCWVKGDTVVGRGTIKFIGKPLWDAKQQTETRKIQWTYGGRTFVKAYVRQHLDRCEHNRTEAAQ